MNPKIEDAGSLSHLHDIITGPPAPWWPPAPAWYVLGVLLFLGTGSVVVWIVVRWHSNWYRRAGLTELQQIKQTHAQEPTALPELANLLKRVALVVFPRQQIASLTGDAWLQFLDRSANTTGFSNGPGRQLLDVYGRAQTPPTPELFQLVQRWIRQHRSDQKC